MSIALDLLKANHMGVKNFKKHVSSKLLDHILVITDHGKPVSVNVPYEEILELVDIVEEMSDPEIVKEVMKGRKAVKEGKKGVPVSEVFQKIRKRHE